MPNTPPGYILGVSRGEVLGVLRGALLDCVGVVSPDVLVSVSRELRAVVRELEEVGGSSSGGGVTGLDEFRRRMRLKRGA
ncbi:MAG: hypothetical protein WAN89_02800 [Lawsonella sp.]